MKGFLFGLGLVCFGATAAETNVVRTRLCDYWKYDTQTSSYVCSFLGSYVSLVESNDAQDTIRNLENRILELETRLERLEKGR